MSSTATIFGMEVRCIPDPSAQPHQSRILTPVLWWAFIAPIAFLLPWPVQAQDSNSGTTAPTRSRGTGYLRRVLESLGLQRRSRDITPGSSALAELWEIEGKLKESDDEE